MFRVNNKKRYFVQHSMGKKIETKKKLRDSKYSREAGFQKVDNKNEQEVNKCPW